jgi:hypothetical protein
MRGGDRNTTDGSSTRELILVSVGEKGKKQKKKKKKMGKYIRVR